MRTRASLSILAVLAALCLASPVAANTGDWEWIYPPTGLEWYYGVDVFDANTIAVVGTSNTRLVSTDGGATWNRQSFGLTYGPLYEVQWIDAATLIACGAFGLVFKSIDAGATWHPIGNVPPVQLLGMQFTSATTGYACASNGNVYKTTNGGTTWTPQSVATATLHDVAFVDDNHGWTVDEFGNVYRTDDGGAAWDLIDTLPFELRSVGLWDFDTAVVAGANEMVYATNNGGSSWTTATLDLAGSDVLVTGIDIAGPNEALLTTETPFGPVMEGRGEVFSTGDQGQTWTRESLALQFLHAVRVNDGVAWAVGKYGRIARSLDAGDTWQDVTPPIQAELRAMAFPTADHGVVMHVQDAQLSMPYTRQWITDDGLATFAEDLFNGGDILEVVDISAVDENVVYAVTHGPTVFDVTAGIRKSVDGGVTWSFIAGSTCPPGNPCPMPFRFTAIDMFADGVGLACTNTGRVYRFFAADDTTSADVGGGTPLRAVAAIGAMFGVTVGDDGFIARTNDGGTIWAPVASGTPNDLNAVSFSPSGAVGLAVGNGATIVRTTDGGETWSPIVIGGGMSLSDVVFVGEQIAVASSVGGVAWISEDGGMTWDQEQVSLQLNDVSVLAATDGGVYAVVAGRGIAYRALEDPVSSVSDPQRATSLGQNHPNPFNPTTEIPFTLAREGDVELTIHDVRGRLVATVLRRSLPAGSHRARWDGRNRFGDPVASGVYFYRLLVQGRAMTRKMVLLR